MSGYQVSPAAAGKTPFIPPEMPYGSRYRWPKTLKLVQDDRGRTFCAECGGMVTFPRDGDFDPAFHREHRNHAREQHPRRMEFKHRRGFLPLAAGEREALKAAGNSKMSQAVGLADKADAAEMVCEGNFHRSLELAVDEGLGLEHPVLADYIAAFRFEDIVAPEVAAELRRRHGDKGELYWLDERSVWIPPSP